MNSLHLDPRQRAMLQEMGVRLWWPAPGEAAAAPAPTDGPAPVRTPLPAAAPPPPVAPRPQAVPAMPVPEARAPQAQAPSAAGAASTLLALQPPRLLYPDIDPEQAPATLGAGWLIVAEGPSDAAPFAGDTGRLLGNMLRALQLHRHPRVYLCTLAAPADAAAEGEPAAVLDEALARLKPSVLLLMGRAAARSALGRTEPLGRLRSEPHQRAGVPAIVTYDLPYLLRAPDAKPAAWADLCRARALAGASAASTG